MWIRRICTEPGAFSARRGQRFQELRAQRDRIASVAALPPAARQGWSGAAPAPDRPAACGAGGRRRIPASPLPPARCGGSRVCAPAQIDVVPEHHRVAVALGQRTGDHMRMPMPLVDMQALAQRRIVNRIGQLAQAAADRRHQAAFAQFAPGGEPTPARGPAQLPPETEGGANRHFDPVQRPRATRRLWILPATSSGDVSSDSGHNAVTDSDTAAAAIASPASRRCRRGPPRRSRSARRSRSTRVFSANSRPPMRDGVAAAGQTRSHSVAVARIPMRTPHPCLRLPSRYYRRMPFQPPVPARRRERCLHRGVALHRADAASAAVASIPTAACASSLPAPGVLHG